jgi:toxin FitB
LPLESAAFHAWAQFAARTEFAGQPLPLMDALVMAIAQCHGLTIVTRDVRDFTIYPQVFNPWALAME